MSVEMGFHGLPVYTSYFSNRVYEHICYVNKTGCEQDYIDLFVQFVQNTK